MCVCVSNAVKEQVCTFQVVCSCIFSYNWTFQQLFIQFSFLHFREKGSNLYRWHFFYEHSIQLRTDPIWMRTSAASQDIVQGRLNAYIIQNYCIMPVYTTAHGLSSQIIHKKREALDHHCFYSIQKHPPNSCLVCTSTTLAVPPGQGPVLTVTLPRFNNSTFYTGK